MSEAVSWRGDRLSSAPSLHEPSPVLFGLHIKSLAALSEVYLYNTSTTQAGRNAF